MGKKKYGKSTRLKKDRLRGMKMIYWKTDCGESIGLGKWSAGALDRARSEEWGVDLVGGWKYAHF